MTKISEIICKNNNYDENLFIKNVIGISKIFQGYTIEYILNDMKIPTFISMLEFIETIKK